jgi:hypothetical protein
VDADDYRIAPALIRLHKVARETVDAGTYPTVEIALDAMTANQRLANRLGVDIHDLLKAHERTVEP